MGSVLASLVLAYDDAQEFVTELERQAEREINLSRPSALLHWDGEEPLPPLDERRRIVQRWIDYEKRKGPCLYDYLQGESDACTARPHVRIALLYYNFHHPGAEFDAVRSLSAEFASFRGEIWSHVNFLARRRDCIDAPVVRFFAELYYYGPQAGNPVVVSCTILRGLAGDQSSLAFFRLHTYLTAEKGRIDTITNLLLFLPPPSGIGLVLTFLQI
ncbi:hypothetical protein E2562_006228 [Oryza meyeriana var. granulata]|uniref:DUF3615 domain-containing protein n=1 Tax=Oryza meyeriana var. granulata TaxID=110450 RepID=A0A6G1CNM9_9ORYZ|nr:hypothetical protein E2562_006228 [Oryza meyeriana var. granulata]